MSEYKDSPTLSVIVPCFNEAETIPVLIDILTPVLDRIDGGACEVVAIDDGSRDETFQRLSEWRESDHRVRVVRLSRNFGKEAALSCGLHFAAGRAAVILDADLQDPPSLLPAMVEKWRQGADVVLARRAERHGEGWVKRMSAAAFYRVMQLLAGDAVPANVGDFRLMDRRVIDALLHVPEKTRFMKGLMNYVGFRIDTLEYTRPGRSTGVSSWNLWRLWNFALEGITSFSTAPLRTWGYLGFLIAFAGLVYAAWIVIRTLIYGIDVPGYASLATMLLFFSGLQLISIGIIGEYLARVFIETKNRPLYVVDAMRGFDDDWVERQSDRVVGNIVLPRDNGHAAED